MLRLIELISILRFVNKFNFWVLSKLPDYFEKKLEYLIELPSILMLIPSKLKLPLPIANYFLF